MKSRMAVDLGEGVGRDRSVVLVRDELGILEVWSSNTASLAEVAQVVARLSPKWGVAHDRISYDKLGVGGEFAHHLWRVGIKHAKPYCGEASPADKARFTNIRTEAAWAVRCRVNPDWCPDLKDPQRRNAPFHVPLGPWWPELREELLALEYEAAGTRTRLLLKERWCARLGRSPDLADAHKSMVMIDQIFQFPARAAGD